MCSRRAVCTPAVEGLGASEGADAAGWMGSAPEAAAPAAAAEAGAPEAAATA